MIAGNRVGSGRTALGMVAAVLLTGCWESGGSSRDASDEDDASGAETGADDTGSDATADRAETDETRGDSDAGEGSGDVGLRDGSDSDGDVPSDAGPCIHDEDCNDGDPCTLDSCTTAGACRHDAVASAEPVVVAGPTALRPGLCSQAIWDGASLATTVVTIGGGALPSDLYLYRLSPDLSMTADVALGEEMWGWPIHDLVVRDGGRSIAVVWSAYPDGEVTLALIADWVDVRTIPLGWVGEAVQLADTGTHYLLHDYSPTFGPELSVIDYDGSVLAGPRMPPGPTPRSLRPDSLLWDGTHVLGAFYSDALRRFDALGSFVDERLLAVPCGTVYGLAWDGALLHGAVACRSTPGISLYLKRVTPEGEDAMPDVPLLESDPGGFGDDTIFVARANSDTLVSWYDSTLWTEQARYCRIPDGTSVASCYRMAGAWIPKLAQGPGTSVAVIVTGEGYRQPVSARLLCFPEVTP